MDCIIDAQILQKRQDEIDLPSPRRKMYLLVVRLFLRENRDRVELYHHPTCSSMMNGPLVAPLQKHIRVYDPGI